MIINWPDIEDAVRPPATLRQRECLHKFEIPRHIVASVTKTQASELISLLVQIVGEAHGE
jgi:hypothetical protein